MPTYSFTAYAITYAGGVPSVFNATTVELVFDEFAPTVLNYFDELPPASPPNPFVFEALPEVEFLPTFAEVVIDGQSENVTPRFVDDNGDSHFGTIFWNDGTARETQVLSLPDFNSQTEYVIPLFGDALNLTSIADYNTFRGQIDVASSGLATGPYAPNTNFDISGSSFATAVPNQTYNGTSGNDAFNSGAGNDTLNGNDGDDTLAPGLGNDSIDGGNNIDTVNYSTVAPFGTTGVIVNLESGVGIKPNGGGTDTLVSIEAAIGSDGDDTMTGANGDGVFNRFEGRDGADSMVGGTGLNNFNEVSYVAETGLNGINANLVNEEIVDTFGKTDVVIGFQQVTGSANNDTMLGDGNNNIFVGTDGNDSLDGAGGADDLSGDAGLDTLIGGDGNDALNGGSGNDCLMGGFGNDTMDGGENDDFIDPGADDGSFGFDLILGSDGNDTINYGNTVSNFQSLDYSLIAGSITATLNVDGNTGSVVKSTGTDTLQNLGNLVNNSDGFEIIGTTQGDSFTVDYNDGIFNNFTILSGRGADSYTILGDAPGSKAGVRINFRTDVDFSDATRGANVNLATGQIFDDGFGNAETITGDGYVSRIDGTGWSDTIIGGAGDEQFRTFAAALDTAVAGDSIDGGAGNDRIRYDAGFFENVVVDLGGGTASGNINYNFLGSSAFTDTLISIEEAIGTRNGNDSITGADGVDNYLRGRGGNDTLVGLGGNDDLEGDDGADSLLGGEGNDTLRGEDGNDTLLGGGGNDQIEAGAGNDSIDPGDGTDFQRVAAGAGTDEIILSNVSGGFLEIDQSDLSGVAITVTLDQAQPSGTINKFGQGVTTLTGVDQFFPDAQLGLVGTTNSDAFNLTLTDEASKIEIRAGRGNDTYNLSEVGRFDVILDRDVIFDIEASQAAVINLNNATEISNDGFGFQDDITGGSVDNFILTRFGDSFTGAGGNDSVQGRDGNDSLVGNGGNDLLEGGDGNDTLNGGTGNDELFGGAGNDSLIIGDGDGFQLIAPGSGSDSIDLNGSITDFTLVVYDDVTNGPITFSIDQNTNTATTTETGGAIDQFQNINNVLLGGRFGIAGTTAGDTFNINNLGEDVFIRVRGGEGQDTFNLSGDVDGELALGRGALFSNQATQAINIDLGLTDNQIINDGFGATEDINGGLFETYRLSQQNDTASGSGGNEQFLGEAGNDSLSGQDGNDSLYGGDGNDTLLGGAGGDFFRGGQGNDSIDGGTTPPEFLDFVSYYQDIVDAQNAGIGGLQGINVAFSLTPGQENNGTVNNDGFGTTDTLINISGLEATNFVDTLVGGVGDDFFRGLAGNDTINGAGGRDWASYGRTSDKGGTQGITIDFINSIFTDTFNNSDTLINIENISGSDFDDVVTGNNGVARWFTGNDGNDTLTGGNLNDTLWGGDGNDSLVGNAGNDELRDGIGTDTLRGGAGNDTLYSDGGATDLYDGGDNTDILIDDLAGLGIAPQSFGLIFNLQTLKHGSDAQAPGDLDDLISIENYQLTGDFDATVTGDNEANMFMTDLGNDTLIGNGGNDTLIGGLGADSLVGGADDDRLEGGLTDTLEGGTGDDLYVLDGAFDSLTDTGGTFDRILIVDNGGLQLNLGVTSGLERVIGGEGGDTVQGATYSTGLNLIGNGGNDSFAGGSGNDTMTGGGGGDTLQGGLGTDILFGNVGDDSIFGGAGRDTINSSLGLDSLDGGADNDIYQLFDGIDIVNDSGGAFDVIVLTNPAGVDLGGQALGGIERVIGSSAGDTMDGSARTTEIQFLGGLGDDSLIGGTQGDRLIGSGGNDTLIGNAGNDDLTGNIGNDSLLGGAGQDTLRGSQDADFMDGGADNDVFRLTDGEDTIQDSGGAFDVAVVEVVADLTLNVGTWTGVERIIGSGGNETIDATGNSVGIEIIGGNGDDTITGGSGADILSGGGDGDSLIGGAGNDNLRGGIGDDNLDGGIGNDTLSGNEGSDTLDGGADNDIFFIPDALDTITDSGGAQDVAILVAALNIDVGSWTGVERLIASGGADEVDASGSAENIELLGGGGNDTLIGGTGNNTFNGQAGLDEFVFFDNFGTDVINGFDALNGDEDINLVGVTNITDFTDLQNNHMAPSGNNVVITDGGNTITITNVLFADLGADDFILT